MTTRPELAGTYGMVSSTHWLASGVGMAVLEKGGNAFDAATAAGLTLQVVEPHLNGPGGEVPIILYSAERERTVVINGQGPTPATASPERFAELGLDLVPGTGFLPACVPGAFDAWMRLLGEFGTLPLAGVLHYAIGYAERGFPLVPKISSTIASVEDLFRSEWPSSAELYLKNSGAPEPGAIFANAALARTYRRILEEACAETSDRDAQIQAARDAFYKGFVAEEIEAWVSSHPVMDTSGRHHRGLLTGDDFAAYEATIEEPASLDYHGYRVFKTGPWGQGPVFLQQLGLLSGFDLSEAGHNSAEYIHTVVECAKLAFADREAWYGDPNFSPVPLEGLLDPAYAQTRRSLVGGEASYLLRPGAVAGIEPRLQDYSFRDGSPQVREDAGTGEPTVSREGRTNGDTTHLDVVDRHGNMVSATPSGGWLQSSPAVPSLGFCLGTRAQMCWLQGGLANSLEGGKRPRTTLSPSFAMREGEPYLAFGTPGGDQQDQWSLNFFLSHVHFGLDLQEAIDSPMFHTTHFPSSFFPRAASPGEIVVEDRIGNEVISRLREMGHTVTAADGWSLGRLSAVSRDSGGLLKAGANSRGAQGYAAGR